MKPPWELAPSWAEWLAMDRSGQWAGFEIEPRWDDARGVWVSHGKSKNVGEKTPPPLHKRP